MRKFLTQPITKLFGRSCLLFHGGHDHFHPILEAELEEFEDGYGYDSYQNRMLDNTIPSPSHPHLEALLKLVMTEEEAYLLSKIPQRTTNIKKIAKKNKIELDKMHEIVDDFAQRGLVFDFYCKGERYIHFPDLVIGWFEFICMRDRDHELPMEELDKLFKEYCVASGMEKYVYLDKEVQLMRTYVREESLRPEVKIMDYESVKKTVENSWLIAVQRCTCKHMFFKSDDMRNNTELYQKKKNLPFDYMETCISFNGVAESLIRNKLAREIDQEECMQIIENCKKEGMVQTASNTKVPSFLCNCEKDTCKFLNGFGNKIDEPFQTSGFIASFNAEACISCKSCVKKCPMDCYKVEGKNIVFDNSLCLGCGVCATVCKGGAIEMIRREEEVFIPDTMLDQIITTSFNRGTLHNLIFNDPSKVTHRVLRKVLGTIEKSKLSDSLRAIKPLKSVFLKTFCTVGSMIQAMPKDV